MGFTSYILASVIVCGLMAAGKKKKKKKNFFFFFFFFSSGKSKADPLVVVLGAYFLMVWDLALDPAMASNYLPLHFWTWHLSGPLLWHADQ